jgi:hypothetical protein
MSAPLPCFGEAELAPLRGSLERSSNSARDLAATAQTRCQRRKVLAVVGISMDAAAERLKVSSPYGQSPFAIQVGDRFEASLRSQHYASLFQALREQLSFPPEAVGLVDLDRDLPLPHPRSRSFRLRQPLVARLRRERTDELLLQALAGDPEAPVVVLHPRLQLRVTDTVRDVEPDALLVYPGSGRPRVGEAKSYVDHGPRTCPQDLAKTRQQAAVYVLALEQAVHRLHAEGRLPDLDQALERLRGPWPQEERRPRADDAQGVFAVTILRKPRSMAPSLCVEEIHRDLETVRRGLQRTPAQLTEVLVSLPEGATLDDPAVLRALPLHYEPGWCLGSCALGLACREEVHQRADPSYFGGVTRAALAPAGDLRHARALSQGERVPATPEEAALAERLRVLRARLDLADEEAS